jgi:biopolymer transport protein ExbD
MKRPSLPPAARLALTPLIDVAFLVIIFFMALPIRRLDGKLSAHMPKEGYREDPQKAEDVVRIRVYRSGEDIRFMLGDQIFADAWQMVPILEKLGPHLRYEIRGDPRLVWQSMVSVVDVLTGLEFTHVQFTYGGGLNPAVRRSQRLPAPTR